MGRTANLPSVSKELYKATLQKQTAGNVHLLGSSSPSRCHSTVASMPSRVITFEFGPPLFKRTISPTCNSVFRCVQLPFGATKNVGNQNRRRSSTQIWWSEDDCCPTREQRNRCGMRLVCRQQTRTKNVPHNYAEKSRIAKLLRPTLCGFLLLESIGTP
jgi:hypothetical protein